MNSKCFLKPPFPWLYARLSFFSFNHLLYSKSFLVILQCKHQLV